ncbi:MAG: transcription elongation factor GreAB [Pedosphaera sp.]|nr:transcription elongation factor GreAB [Pedosphaera sp.]
MTKRQIIERVREELLLQFERSKKASEMAREYATDEESRARSKYDTQGLEASYLAAGQAERAEDLAATIATFNAAPFPPFTAQDAITEGALVEVLLDGERSWFLLSPCAGGMTIEFTGGEVTLLGPAAPLRKKLLGLKAGAILKDPKLTIRSVA